MSEEQETSHEVDADNEARESSVTAQGSDGGAETGKGRSSASGRKGNAAAWLALIVALAAGGFTAWQWWMSRSAVETETDALLPRVEGQADEIEDQSRALGEMRERVDALNAGLEDLSSRVESDDFDPAALRRQVRSQAEAIEQLREVSDSRSQRLDRALESMETRLEQSGAAESTRIEDSLADARFRMALMEVAGLLRLGQARAELASDLSGAVAAYERARARLEGIDDGRLEQLRQLLSREVEALRSVGSTDWAAISGRLSALESDSARWPVAGGDAAAQARADESDAASEQGWWSSVRESLGGLVRVTPREAAPLAPAAVESVRERLRLHLAAAQAAVAGRRVEELRNQVDAAEALIRDHFDTSSEPVSRALETLTEALSADEPSLPDLGAALAEAERRLGAS